MLRIAAVVSIAISLAFLGPHARAQGDATPLSVEGHGFKIATLCGGGGAFANRKYVWEQVPPEFEGWKFTKTSGGVRADISVAGPSDGYVYIAIDTASRPTDEGLPGWERYQNLSLQLTDSKRTLYAIYRTHHAAGTELTIPQIGWGGGLVLSPGLTRINEPAEAVSSAEVVVGAPVIHSRVVVAGAAEAVVVHPRRVHITERRVVHHVYRRVVEIRRAPAVHTTRAKRPPIKAGGHL